MPVNETLCVLTNTYSRSYTVRNTFCCRLLFFLFYVVYTDLPERCSRTRYVYVH